jgi:hypothetical protein
MKTALIREGRTALVTFLFVITRAGIIIIVVAGVKLSLGLDVIRRGVNVSFDVTVTFHSVAREVPISFFRLLTTPFQFANMTSNV